MSHRLDIVLTAVGTPNYADLRTQRYIRHIFTDMGLCGCGSMDKYEIVERLLERALAGGSYYEPLDDTLSGRAVEFIADVMNSWGLLEHGTSIAGSFLTDKGTALLQFFRMFGTDPESWPEWWCSCGVGEEY